MTGLDLCVLDEDHRPVPTQDIAAWARQDRRVALTVVGDYRVSTVFLGLDHGWGETPQWFETMVFGLGSARAQSDGTWRYATWEEALIGHDVAVTLISHDARVSRG